MPDPREARSLIDAAEKAAAAGDYAAAETALREAALLQEASLGPLHPDLANTFNNLGVVCEIVEKPADAERCFRRAYMIATTSLKSDHPFVATSTRNLRDFCDARGVPFESSDTPKALPHAAAAGVPVKRTSFYPIGGLAAVLVLALIASRLWSGADGRVDAPQTAATIAPAPTEPVAPAPLESPARVPEALPAPPSAKMSRASSAASTQLSVLEAKLCSALSPDQWHCETASRPVTSGRLSFYTRITSPADTTVQHRWYRGDRLHQDVELRIQPNQGGYRTYSRTTITAASAGEWRVELRASDGTLLHEERFVVR